MTQGDKLIYGFKEEIVGIPLTATVVIEFALRDDTGLNFVCARFNGKVHSKPRVEPIDEPSVILV